MSHGGESELWREEIGERRASLSTVQPTRGERRVALAAVLASTALFIACAPLARRPLEPLWAFIPVYQSALVVNDLITAVLLFGYFGFLRSPALLVLASGYLFAALIAVAHALAFPSLLTPAALPGAGPQSAAWLYLFWHGLFPLFVLAYAFLKGERRESGGFRVAPGVAVAGSIAGTILIVSGLALLATAGEGWLPAIMRDGQHAPAMLGAASSAGAASLLALAALWRRRPHSLLDLWLMAVMCAWLFDIALAALLNAGRFDLGFYAGRIYGLLAASFLLAVLLRENRMLYARLAQAHESERRERRRAQEKTAELAAANKELEEFSYSVSHDLRAPLRAIDGYSRMLEEDSGEHLGEEGRRLLGVVRSSSRRMGRLIDGLLVFSRLGQQELSCATIDMTRLAQGIAAGLAREFPAARVLVGELPPAFADGGLLKQVWSNLIGNALKYSGKRDGAQIEIGGRTEPAENVYWVRDNGVGFDMRYAGRLFGVFQRLHSHDEFPGTGVGLAIVQRVILRHRGRVWAEARPQEGACFYFSLPKEDGPAAP